MQSTTGDAIYTTVFGRCEPLRPPATSLRGSTRESKAAGCGAIASQNPSPGYSRWRERERMKGQGRNAGGLVVTTREIPSTSASSLINTQLKTKSRHSRSYIKSLLNGSTNNTCKRIKTAQPLSSSSCPIFFFPLEASHGLSYDLAKV
jgi:hypothetical protein